MVIAQKQAAKESEQTYPCPSCGRQFGFPNGFGWHCPCGKTICPKKGGGFVLADEVPAERCPMCQAVNRVDLDDVILCHRCDTPLRRVVPIFRSSDSGFVFVVHPASE